MLPPATGGAPPPRKPFKRYVALALLLVAVAAYAAAQSATFAAQTAAGGDDRSSSFAAQWRKLLESGAMSVGDGAIPVSEEDTYAAPSPPPAAGAAPAAAAGGGGSPPDDGGSPPDDGGTPDYLRGTAVVTMAAGDDAGRLAVALVQSLRDSGTRIPTIEVMLARGGRGSADCHNETWKASVGRGGVPCSAPDALPEEIVSRVYLDALAALGATTRVIDTIPETPWTSKIPGGRVTFWGMAWQKLRVFNLTEYRKVLWLDSDTLVLRNVDHLLREPPFTAAFTHACCNPNAPAVPSGGLWVLEPSAETGLGLWRMMNAPLPGSKEGDGDYERYWMFGDMQLVRYYFGNMTSRSGTGTEAQPLWPFAEDASTGIVPGLRHLPAYRGATDAELAELRVWRAGGPLVGRDMGEGFQPGLHSGRTAPWRILDPRYDQCVGNCACLPQRDAPDAFFTVHFSCLPSLPKPGEFPSEAAMGELLFRRAPGCVRHYFATWYRAFTRAGLRHPPPLWGGGPPIEGPDFPHYNATHDALVEAWKAADAAAAAAAKAR